VQSLSEDLHARLSFAVNVCAKHAALKSWTTRAVCARCAVSCAQWRCGCTQPREYAVMLSATHAFDCGPARHPLKATHAFDYGPARHHPEFATVLPLRSARHHYPRRTDARGTRIVGIDITQMGMLRGHREGSREFSSTALGALRAYFGAEGRNSLFGVSNRFSLSA
jgi:hypothetical protein